MSSSCVQRISCRACAAVQDFTAWESINVTENPELRGPLMRGELFALRCGQCGAETALAYDLLYHDMADRLMIWLIHDDGVAAESAELAPLPELKGAYRRRMVRSTDLLLEKIRLFHDGHDDRVMELFKLALTGSLVAEGTAEDGALVYGGTTPDDKVTFVLRGDEGERVIGVSHREEYLPFYMEYLAKLGAAAAGEAEGRWLEVDRGWAVKHLGAGQKSGG